MVAEVEQHVVNCEQGDIIYLLTRKQVKNVNLRIKPDGKIFVSAHYDVPISFIDNFIEQKQRYILSTLAKYNKKRNLVQNVPKRYISGENYELLGKNLRLKVVESKQESVYTDGVYIFLKVENKENFRHKEAKMLRWLHEFRISVYTELIQKQYALFQKYGVPYPELKVRHMTSRWGSCHPRKGVITLNSQLIAAPKNCIEYVVLHEFVHFIYPNHSRQFWDFLGMMMPDWKERKKELERRLFS